MKYIIFDIDGTLTDTTTIDDYCFTRAIEDIFNFRNFNTDYGHYEHTTDSGIINQLFIENLGRACTEEERDKFISHFCSLLEQEHQKQPDCMREISRAGKTLETLYQQEHISVGLATGGWRESAQFKLRCAGINIEGCAAASFAQDAMARHDIIAHTIRKMDEKHQQETALSDIVYIGDGNWDYEATKKLGIQFIGIENKRIAHLNKIIKIIDYNDLSEHLGWYA
ncbi:HAD hydrolase-like protein [Pedobacter sp. L105]|uniref:HAD hydrolase-like protein n=1 Tax=Pedobacter sp. L105 TaxID=1641871 RepID=UPI00131E8CA5|nr:HAD hydrolase-like protein [Pedobacter sp. L105]